MCSKTDRRASGQLQVFRCQPSVSWLFSLNQIQIHSLNNSSAPCRIFARVLWSQPWGMIECQTVNDYFLLLWSSWWSHDSSTVQCTCSCVVFVSMNYCWDCKFTVLAMHCSSSSFSTVCLFPSHFLSSRVVDRDVFFGFSSLLHAQLQPGHAGWAPIS